MSLPPLPNFRFMWYPHEKEEIAEYGRQCWNAAIQAALDTYYDYDDGGGPQDNTDVAIRKLMITTNTVSTPE
jgi:hypothetical protein